MVDQSEKLVELAVVNRFLSRDSAGKLLSESLKLGLPVEAFALKSGVLSPWQIDALRWLCHPEELVPGYRLKNMLGRGGFGSVFRATQTNMDRDVALKTIPLNAVKDSSAARRFEREAKIVGQLRHPHIVAAYDFGFHKDHLFLSLELVEGNDLGNLIRRVKKLDEYTALHVIRQTVTALAYAAEKGITHRDIKPGNLLLTETPIGYSLPKCVPFVKVADFGLACFTETRRDEAITLENSGIGTPSYVAPEQLQGRNDVDVRADIYSLGATAYKLMTGVAPYDAVPAMAVAKEKLSGNETWLNQMESLSPQSQELIRKMSAFSVENRFLNHRELLVAIDMVIGGLSKVLDAPTREFELSSIDASANAPSATEVSLWDDESETKDTGVFDSNFEINVPPSDRKARTMSGRKWQVGTAVAILLTILVVGWVGSHIFIEDRDVAALASTFEPDISSSVLSFDGLKVDYSKFKVKKGTWAIDQDEDGGKILLGRNCSVVFPCNDNDGLPFDFFKYEVGIGLDKNLEVRLSMIDDQSKEPLVWLKLTSEGSEIFRGGYQRQSSLTPLMKWPGNVDNPNGYFKLVFERYPGFWQIRRDSTVIGTLKSLDQKPVSVLVEVVGEARFESPRICRLVEQAAVEN